MIWIALILVVISSLYWYFSKQYNYWKTQDVPYLTRWPLLDILRLGFITPLHILDQQRYKKYGRIYGYYEGSYPALVVAEPDILRDVLVKDFFSFSGRRDFRAPDPMFENMVSVMPGGEKWKRIRTAITPAFSTGKMKRMTDLILDCGWTLVNNFKKEIEGGKPIDMKKYYAAYTMDVIACCAFGTKIDSHNNPNNVFISHAAAMFSKRSSLKFLLLLMAPRVLKLLNLRLLPKFFADVVLEIMEERKRSGNVHNDFLQLLMDAKNRKMEMYKHGPASAQENSVAKGGQKDEMYNKINDTEEDDINDMGHEEENSKIFKQDDSNKTISDDEIVAQCVIFFLAGFAGSSVLLTLVSYFLAVHPDCQEKIIEEIDNEIKKNEGQLTYDTVRNMTYLDNVIAETLRIVPSGPRTERKADHDYEIKGVTVKKDMLITIPIYAIHHDPEHYPDPEKFDPDRFTPEAKAKRHPYAYLPFGAGPRNCVGMRFALMETKLCLALIFSQFRVKTCEETDIPLQFQVSIQNLEPRKIKLKMELRKDKVFSRPT